MSNAYSGLFWVGSFFIFLTQYQVLCMDMGMITVMELYDLMLDETLSVLVSRIV